LQNENSHALRLTSKLVDLRAANANLIPRRLCLAEQGAKRLCSNQKENTILLGGVSFCEEAHKRCASVSKNAKMVRKVNN